MFHLRTVWLVVVLVAVVGGFTAVGIVVGRHVGARPDAESNRLASYKARCSRSSGCCSRSGSRWQSAYLRAQLLPEPARTTSLELLVQYGDIASDLAEKVPLTDRFDATSATVDSLQRDLWAAAGDAVQADPTGTARAQPVTIGVT